MPQFAVRNECLTLLNVDKRGATSPDLMAIQARRLSFFLSSTSVDPKSLSFLSLSAYKRRVCTLKYESRYKFLTEAWYNLSLFTKEREIGFPGGGSAVR